ncbi:MAG: heavy metal-binding domain-containing protein [Planctomycetota bacterium]
MNRRTLYKSVVAAVLLAVLATAGPRSRAADVVSGRDLLKAVRDKENSGQKPAYEDRSEMPAKTPQAGEIPMAGETPNMSPAKTVGDPLLQMIPADSLFCLRVNNFDFTLSQIDQFLAGVSPIPMGLSMVIRMNLAELLGSPELNGVNMGGTFVAFGPLPGTDLDDFDSIAVLVPVTDYKQFITGNPNIGEPDAMGISGINGQGMPPVSVAQVQNYALITRQGNDVELAAAAKSLSSAVATGLASTLNVAQAKAAVEKPLWAWGNVRQASKTFGPLISSQLEEMKASFEQMNAAQKQMVGDPGVLMGTYASILDTLMKETKSISLTLTPKPDLCTLGFNVEALPGSEMAGALTSLTVGAKDDMLLGYLENDAIANFALRTKSGWWKKLNEMSMDLLVAFAPQDAKPEDVATMKKLVSDSVDSMAGPMAFSISTDAKNKPPFAASYVMALSDVDKYKKVLEQSTAMMNTGPFADLYRNMGMEISFEMTPAVATYRGVAIDAAKFGMKALDQNSPEAQMIAMFYGDGLDYRWAAVDRLFVGVIAGDRDAAIRKLIDQAKAGTPQQPPSEIRAALSILPEAANADTLMTFNLLRAFKMIPAIMGAMMPIPLPEVDIQTTSNIVCAGNTRNGQISVDIALPKQHLMEIMAAVQKMQEQMPKSGEPGAMNLWTCPMHPDVVVPEEGKCPKCGMDLVPFSMPGTPTEGPPEHSDVEADFPPGTIVSSARLRRVDFPQMYGKTQTGFSVPLAVKLPEPAIAVAEGAIQKAITRSNQDVLSQNEWNREIHFPKLARDKRTAEFDVELRQPDEERVVFKEISGTLVYLTAKGTKEMDLGAMNFESGAESTKHAGFAIAQIERDPTAENSTTMELKVNLPVGAVKSVKIYGETGRPVRVSTSGSASSGDSLLSIDIDIEGKLPPKGRIVLAVFENIQKHTIAFIFKGKGNVAERPMRPGRFPDRPGEMPRRPPRDRRDQDQPTEPIRRYPPSYRPR